MRKISYRWTRPAVLALVLALAGPLSVLAGGADVVRVDCAKKSIQEALEKTADELIVEFEGVCVEDVVIRRDRTTLRGVAPGAAIVGSQEPDRPYDGGVTVVGATNVTLSDFTVRDGRRGVTIRSGGAARLERLTLQDHLRDGLVLLEGSDAAVEDCTVVRNGSFGVSVWESSSLTVGSRLVTSGNGAVGLLVSTGASVSTASDSRIEADDNTWGIISQLGGTADLRGGVHTAQRNDLGVGVIFDGFLHGTVEIRDNLTIGAYVASHSSLVHDGPVTGNGVFGIYAEEDARLEYGGPEVSGHAIAMLLDGTEALISNATVSGPVELRFGTRVHFGGGNSFAGGVSCDGTVLVRGDVSCPTAVGQESRLAVEGRTINGPLASPFTLEP